MSEQGSYVFLLELLSPGTDTDGCLEESSEIQAASPVLAACQAVATVKDDRVLLSLQYGETLTPAVKLVPYVLTLARAGLREAGLDGAMFISLTAGTIDSAESEQLDLADEMIWQEW
jgi:hypothetical protein